MIKLLNLLFNNKKVANLGISVPATKNTLGNPGGSVLELSYWVRP